MARMNVALLSLGLGMAAAFPLYGEENSALRLGKAQQGMAEASWPKRPDDRLSSFSGRTKEIGEISSRSYGQTKELTAPLLSHREKQAPLAHRPAWDGAKGNTSEADAWGGARDSPWGGKPPSRFQTEQGSSSTGVPRREFRQLERPPAPEWVSRATRVGRQEDGSLRMYEGRLTRIRQEVRREDKNVRDLGPGRQERFSPDEVEKILSQPAPKSRRAATEQSAGASPLAAADNSPD